MTEEKVYYESGNILVTNSRAIMNDKTYAMANVTSVSKGEIRPPKTLIYILWFIGAILSIIGILGPADLFPKLVAGAIGVGAIVLGYYLNKQKKYVIVLGSASGETEALKSKNQKLIDKLIGSINQAIIERG